MEGVVFASIIEEEDNVKNVKGVKFANIINIKDHVKNVILYYV